MAGGFDRQNRPCENHCFRPANPQIALTDISHITTVKLVAEMWTRVGRHDQTRVKKNSKHSSEHDIVLESEYL